MLGKNPPGARSFPRVGPAARPSTPTPHAKAWLMQEAPEWPVPQNCCSGWGSKRQVDQSLAQKEGGSCQHVADS